VPHVKRRPHPHRLRLAPNGIPRPAASPTDTGDQLRRSHHRQHGSARSRFHHQHPGTGPGIRHSTDFRPAPSRRPRGRSSRAATLGRLGRSPDEFAGDRSRSFCHISRWPFGGYERSNCRRRRRPAIIANSDEIELTTGVIPGELQVFGELRIRRTSKNVRKEH
jgi:hypothetical protein